MGSQRRKNFCNVHAGDPKKCGFFAFYTFYRIEHTIPFPITMRCSKCEHNEKDEDILCTVRFSQGENVKVTISFDDIVPMSYVIDFVKQSPVQGWRVTLIGEYNTNASILCTNVIAWRKLSIYLRLNDYEYTYIHWEPYMKNTLLSK